MDRIFLSPNKDDAKNQLLLQLRACLIENRAIIDQVCFHFVFTGDPKEAERSKVLDKLREDLENRKYLVDQFFGERNVGFVCLIFVAWILLPAIRAFASARPSPRAAAAPSP
jgi:hypothetical protein